jgi:dienelactone hydrolase
MRAASFNFSINSHISISASVMKALKVAGIAALSVVITGGSIGAYIGYQVVKNMHNEEFTPDDERKKSDVAVVFSNGLGNPRARCAVALPNELLSSLCPAIFLLQYPKYFNARFFATYPKHALVSRSNEADDCVAYVAMKPEIKKIIRAGHSCGASDAIVDLCTKPQHEKVKGVLAISPFAHTDDIVDNWVGWVPAVNWIARAVTAHIVLRKFKGHQPIDMVEQALPEAKKIPVRIVASTGDWTVPASSSKRLAVAMQKAGFDISLEVHQNGGHDFAFVSNDKTETNAWLDRVLADKNSAESAAAA